ncbi:MAG: peptidoglycan DD-metalloendopeptidase family protein [Nitriliruptorales bacterium]|nr:peptidoglycan DD-metalloendopeptidase family protein [Nitriliruptorales bacterium]
MRRGGRRLLLLCAVLLLVASTAAWAHDADDVRNELEQTQSQLENAKDELENTKREVSGAEEELRLADLRLHDMVHRLRDAEAELAAAEAELAEARSKSADARSRLERVTQRLAQTKEELAAHEQRFKDRVAANYKYGTISYASVLLGSRDVGQFLNTKKYVQSVMDEDRDVIETVANATRRLVELRAEADQVREELEREEASAEALAARVEEAAERQRQLTAQVQQERSRRASLLAQLESEEANYEALVDSLEAESAALEEELKKLESVGQAPGPGGLFWPTDGYLTSNYGWRTHPIFGSRRMHTGIDISGSTGQPIIAAASGTVVHAGWRGGYGLAVVIDHGGGMATLYAHQSSLSVTTGQRVDGGQKVGAVGSTGYSTGPHLHFEVRINGEPRDPLNWY